MITQPTFSLASVHDLDIFRIFVRLELSSLSTLDSGVSDRGESISASAVSTLSEGEEAVDEGIP